jgi:general secretion pathway protein A
MYLNSFGLKKNPFQMTSDPAYLYFSPRHRECAAGLAYAIISRKGFVLLTGEAGTGKTTVLTKILQHLPLKIQSSVIFNPTVTAAEFLELVMLDFGFPSAPVSKAQRITQLQQFLLKANSEGKIAALVVDEAHMLSPEVLEEIRLLGNFESGGEKLLQVVLSGQPELNDLLNRKDLRQFKQRVALRLSIDPLTTSEVEGYLAFRWSTAGGDAPHPFPQQTAATLARISGGIPRIINALCDNALVAAFSEGARTVTSDHVAEAARVLAFTDGSDRITSAASPPLTDSPGRQAAAPWEAVGAPTLKLLGQTQEPIERPSLLSRWTGKLRFNN